MVQKVLEPNDHATPELYADIFVVVVEPMVSVWACVTKKLRSACARAGHVSRAAVGRAGPGVVQGP